MLRMMRIKRRVSIIQTAKFKAVKVLDRDLTRAVLSSRVMSSNTNWVYIQRLDKREIISWLCSVL